MPNNSYIVFFSPDIFDELAKTWMSTDDIANKKLTDGPEIMKDSIFFEYLWQFSLF